MKTYKRIRRWIRRLRYTKVPTGILYRNMRNEEFTGKPVAVRGFLIAVEAGKRNTELISVYNALDRSVFVRAWYALGGGNAMDEDGIPIDPDDI